MTTKILIDCDPGVDDALAILLALASPELEVVGITVVAGNCPAPTGLGNALALLDLVGAGPIPVALGCQRPLLRPLVTAPHVHGPSGLGNARLLSLERRVYPGHAVELIGSAAREHAGELTLVAIGPLTNLALALHQEPELPRLLKGVVVMGGALTVPGNVTPAAEFNFFVDPHAARMVLGSGLPITLVGLDVTRQVALTPEAAEELLGVASPVSRFVADACRFAWEREGGGEARLTLHDPLAVALTFAPDLVETRPVCVDVETQGELTLGQSVADFQGRWGRPANVQAALAVDADRFLRLFVERLGELARAHRDKP